MNHEEIDHWLRNGARRQLVLGALDRPLTVSQLMRRVELSMTNLSNTLWELWVYGLVECLTPEARSFRVYGLTEAGARCRAMLFPENEKTSGRPGLGLPTIDWPLYSWVSSRHRKAVLFAMYGEARPCMVRTYLKRMHPEIQISTNNVWSIMKLFRFRQILVDAGRQRSSERWLALTATGKALQRAMLLGDQIPCPPPLTPWKHERDELDDP